MGCYNVVIAVENPDGKLLPGDGERRFRHGRGDRVLTVPNARAFADAGNARERGAHAGSLAVRRRRRAIRRRPADTAFLWFVDSAGSSRVRYTGLSDGQRTEVNGGGST